MTTTTAVKEVRSTLKAIDAYIAGMAKAEKIVKAIEDYLARGCEHDLEAEVCVFETRSKQKGRSILRRQFLSYTQVEDGNCRICLQWVEHVMGKGGITGILDSDERSPWDACDHYDRMCSFQHLPALLVELARELDSLIPDDFQETLATVEKAISETNSAWFGKK